MENEERKKKRGKVCNKISKTCLDMEHDHISLIMNNSLVSLANDRLVINIPQFHCHLESGYPNPFFWHEFCHYFLYVFYLFPFFEFSAEACRRLETVATIVAVAAVAAVVVAAAAAASSSSNNNSSVLFAWRLAITIIG